jgi:hypothetical protein
MKRSPTAALLIVAGALVVIAGTVYVLVAVVNKKAAPPAPVAQQPPPPPPTTQPDESPALIPAKKMPPAAQVTGTAEALIDAYSKLEDTTQAAPASPTTTAPIVRVDPGYRGKIIEVTGRVFGKGDSEFTGHYIALAGGVERTRGVNCKLAAENVDQLGSIAKGQVVIIRGLCNELAKDIELVDCAVVKILPEE